MEMHMRQSQNPSPVKLERMSAKLPEVRATNQIHSIESTRYSGGKKKKKELPCLLALSRIFKTNCCSTSLEVVLVSGFLLPVDGSVRCV